MKTEVGAGEETPVAMPDVTYAVLGVDGTPRWYAFNVALEHGRRQGQWALARSTPAFARPRVICRFDTLEAALSGGQVLARTEAAA